MVGTSSQNLSYLRTRRSSRHTPTAMEIRQMATTLQGSCDRILAYVLVRSCETYTSLNLFDTSRLDLVSPHPIWSAAGRDSVSTKRATYVLWLLLGCYNTGERLFKMGKVRTPHCLLCAETTEADSPVIDNREHFLLSCPALHDISKLLESLSQNKQ